MIDLAAVIEQFLEPATPGVLVELDRDDAAVLAAEVRAARAVVAAAAVDAYDQATSTPPTSTAGGVW